MSRQPAPRTSGRIARIGTRKMDLHSQQGIESALQDDAILPSTRLVAAGVIPFLIAAFIILYLLPGTTGERFAWEIGSPLTAALMGAGYLGGAYFF
ncbi:MAG TPA: hypothetical protein VF434_12145, partial [Promineifilum sp.]